MPEIKLVMLFGDTKELMAPCTGNIVGTAMWSACQCDHVATITVKRSTDERFVGVILDGEEC